MSRRRPVSYYELSDSDDLDASPDFSGDSGSNTSRLKRRRKNSASPSVPDEGISELNNVCETNFDSSRGKRGRVSYIDNCSDVELIHADTEAVINEQDSGTTDAAQVEGPLTKNLVSASSVSQEVKETEGSMVAMDPAVEIEEPGVKDSSKPGVFDHGEEFEAFEKEHVRTTGRSKSRRSTRESDVDSDWGDDADDSVGSVSDAEFGDESDSEFEEPQQKSKKKKESATKQIKKPSSATHKKQTRKPAKEKTSTHKGSKATESPGVALERRKTLGVCRVGATAVPKLSALSSSPRDVASATRLTRVGAPRLRVGLSRNARVPKLHSYLDRD